jgi:hypothetical protein
MPDWSPPAEPFWHAGPRTKEFSRARLGQIGHGRKNSASSLAAVMASGSEVAATAPLNGDGAFTSDGFGGGTTIDPRCKYPKPPFRKQIKIG